MCILGNGCLCGDRHARSGKNAAICNDCQHRMRLCERHIADRACVCQPLHCKTESSQNTSDKNTAEIKVARDAGLLREKKGRDLPKSLPFFSLPFCFILF